MMKKKKQNRREKETDTFKKESDWKALNVCDSVMRICVENISTREETVSGIIFKKMKPFKNCNGFQRIPFNNRKIN